MFLAGDEFGNTQYGNNNTYCQDNEVSWLDWGLLKKNREIFEFFKYMIAFRKAHPAITRELPGAWSGHSSMSCYDGVTGSVQITPDTRILGVLFAGHLEKKGQDDLVYVVFNPHWEEQDTLLPGLPFDYAWHIHVNTGAGETGEFYERTQPYFSEKIHMSPRSVIVFAAQRL